MSGLTVRTLHITFRPFCFHILSIWLHIELQKQTRELHVSNTVHAIFPYGNSRFILSLQANTGNTFFKLTMTVFFQIASYGVFTSVYLRIPFFRDMGLRHWVIRSRRCEVPFCPHIQEEPYISAHADGDIDKSHKNGILPSQILIQHILI